MRVGASQESLHVVYPGGRNVFDSNCWFNRTLFSTRRWPGCGPSRIEKLSLFECPTVARCGLASNLTRANLNRLLWGLHSLAFSDMLITPDQEYVGLADVYARRSNGGFVKLIAHFPRIHVLTLYFKEQL